MCFFLCFIALIRIKMIFFRSLIIFLISLIIKTAAVQSPPIPTIPSKFPRCSAISSPIQEKWWKCPEGSPVILTSQICDGFLHCQRSFADERNCVRLSNETENSSLDMARMYIPSIQCSATICFDEMAFSNEINAHLICRHLGFMTFKNVGFMENKNSNFLSLRSDSLQCFGHETNIQNCLKEELKLKLHQCNSLLTVDCQPECQTDLQSTSGTIMSPGYPNVSFSMLDCIWTITGPEGSIFDLQFIDVNLQDMPDEEQQHVDLCSNSYIEVGLGYNETNKAINRFRRLRLCRQVHAKNYTSLGNRIYIRYISGQFFGPMEDVNGFQMTFKNIRLAQDTKHHDIDHKDIYLSNGYIALIAICAIFGLFSTVIMFVWWYKRRQNLFQMKRKFDEEMIREKCKSNDYFTILLHAYDFHQFPRTLTCPKCEKVCRKSSELCSHFKRLHNQLVQEDNDRIAKDLLSNRLNGAYRNKNSTRISNVTVDLDDLFGSRLSQQPSVATLIKSQETINVDNAIVTSNNEEPTKKSFMMTNFLEPFVSVAKKLSSSSWRTPSPNKTSTPTMDDEEKREKRRKYQEEHQNNRSRKSPSPDSPMIATIRQTARKLKLHSDLHLNPKKVLKVCSTSAARRPKPPKIVVFPSSVRRQPASPTFVTRNYDKKQRSVSLQLLTVNGNRSANNSLSPIIKRYPSKPTSAPGQFGEYSKFQSLSSFNASPINNVLNENIVVEVHNNCDSVEQTPQVFVHL